MWSVFSFQDSPAGAYLATHIFFSPFPRKRHTAERAEGCFEASYGSRQIAERAGAICTPSELLQTLHCTVSTGKNVAECKRNRPLQNNFDFYRKEELSDEEGRGEKSWLQLPSLLNTVKPTFVMSTPVFVGLGL